VTLKRLRAELTEALARLMMENDDKSPALVKFTWPTCP